MPYCYLDDIATADVAFSAWGATLEEMFVASADALMNAMVEDLSTIRDETELSIHLYHEELDLLLFNYLSELIFLKDARTLLLRVTSVTIDFADSVYHVRAKAAGELIDPQRHPLIVDVKAVTLHQFSVEQTVSGWKTQVILDI